MEFSPLKPTFIYVDYSEGSGQIYNQKSESVYFGWYILEPRPKEGDEKAIINAIIAKVKSVIPFYLNKPNDSNRKITINLEQITIKYRDKIQTIVFNRYM